MYKKYRKGVFIVVFSMKPLRYLLLHRKWHWQGWEFPKGGSLAREKIENTVKREVREETGLKIISLIPFEDRGKFIYDKKAQQYWRSKGFSWKLYAAEVKKARAKINKKEHDHFKWLSYKKAIKLLTWPSQKRALKIVNNTLKKI